MENNKNEEVKEKRLNVKRSFICEHPFITLFIVSDICMCVSTIITNVANAKYGYNQNQQRMNNIKTNNNI